GSCEAGPLGGKRRADLSQEQANQRSRLRAGNRRRNEVHFPFGPAEEKALADSRGPDSRKILKARCPKCGSVASVPAQAQAGNSGAICGSCGTAFRMAQQRSARG